MKLHGFSQASSIAVTSTEKDKPLILKELAVLFCTFLGKEESATSFDGDCGR